MFKAVSVVVCRNQLQHGELSSGRYGQVKAQTQAGDGGVCEPQAVALTRQTPHSFTGRHVVQHVDLQQTRLLL